MWFPFCDSLTPQGDRRNWIMATMDTAWAVERHWLACLEKDELGQVVCKIWTMSEEREDSSQEYEHSVLEKTWAESVKTLFRQPHPLFHHPATAMKPREFTLGSLIWCSWSLPMWCMCNCGLGWERMQSYSLLGNTASKTPSQRKIGPSATVLVPSKLWEALVQVTPPAAFSVDTRAVRRTSQVPWHWGFPILPRTQESILFSSQLPVTRTIHWGESVVLPHTRGICRLVFHPKGEQQAFWAVLPPPQQFLSFS